MSDYTPRLEELRSVWGLAVDFHRRPERLDEFDRCLASVKAEAWSEGFSSGADVTLHTNWTDEYREARSVNPYRKETK